MKGWQSGKSTDHTASESEYDIGEGDIDAVIAQEPNILAASTRRPRTLTERRGSTTCKSGWHMRLLLSMFGMTLWLSFLADSTLRLPSTLTELPQ